ncbi:type II toxin-antitoxin system VapC family toxin [Komarekiella sp. 'clone 1']|uniref:Ribonuclease VapC n=1 Tax=Komarekiella delphini-convector SJRDD-AB1 TaxID=2593771 RepID=A0AA40SZE7_9NOST|nr:PIN domain-containing protein [Komarekiella delphini-convector]MBD6618124.1 type II toxin-antitoxin system VapC family toxin [Komarekiella delphini-convector SJRDD-AB1]
MDKVLIDTDIFSEILKGINRHIAARASAYHANFGYYTICTITVLEIVKGWHKRQREDKIQQFFVEIIEAQILTLQLSDAELAGRIYADLERTGQPIGLADAIIAAIAIQQNLTLVSGNLSHYQRIQALGYSLKLDNWRI